jgi:hypothetical protein
MGVPSLSLSDYAIGELLLIERGRQHQYLRLVGKASPSSIDTPPEQT